ncbi:M23 family metallopeptidase [Sporanaerobacter acetigenes]|uniref:Peptidase family M23 n=1 Tax=Sporanaerobacter acetigenes DSM 13106 TaxID=1123281 RepID=A0A1M5SVR0_9FIRM|nr:M23 family metallopeptidase [Sporanaerobacter acetigenes]SHH42577.1 Peptidase family M23 [Sporanaerobacter acetigenes DSM 13106]
MKNKFSWEKDGFYIILFICVCVVAVTSVWVSRNNLKKIESNDKPIKDEDFFVVEDGEMGDYEKDLMEPSLASAKMGENKEEDKEDLNLDEDLEEPEKLEEEKPKPEAKETFCMPVEGKMILDFTGENLVYSKTLEEWTSHGGVDIEAKEGTPVKASLGGTVSEAYEDELWGVVIVLDHENGLKTKYANLSTKDMVQVGQKVKKGDTISGIGKPKGIEMADAPHLHFEVILNEENMDPKNYLPNLN